MLETWAFVPWGIHNLEAKFSTVSLVNFHMYIFLLFFILLYGMSRYCLYYHFVNVNSTLRLQRQ